MHYGKKDSSKGRRELNTSNIELWSVLRETLVAHTDTDGKDQRIKRYFNAWDFRLFYCLICMCISYTKLSLYKVIHIRFQYKVSNILSVNCCKTTPTLYQTQNNTCQEGHWSISLPHQLQDPCWNCSNNLYECMNVSRVFLHCILCTKLKKLTFERLEFMKEPLK